MKKLHPHETLLETIQYNGISVDLIRWDKTIWCGKLGYAETITDDLDVGAISDAFLAMDSNEIYGRLEPNCNVCMNLNHITEDKPKGVMFAYLVDTDKQPNGFDVLEVPSGHYMCIPLGDNNVATALDVEPWYGGPPPWTWISEHIAPKFGYACSGDALPVFEYYVFDNGEGNAWLYVPVEKIS